MVKIKVDLKERSYDILIDVDCLSSLGKVIEKNWGNDFYLITDPLVYDLYGNEVEKGFERKIKVLEVPRGERYKSLKEAAKLYDKLVNFGAHRDSLIIALGGGVIGDLAGFVAATYMRGINYLQVPTTLLAQVDAAIGGKTAVNHPKCKNLIGVFHQPRLVFIDVKTITTLPAHQLRIGLAEVVKYGIIADAEFFKFLEANAHHLNTAAFEAPDTLRASLKLWQTIVAEAAKVKAQVVEKDEFETGLRMILNYGHTIGHALETLTRYRAYHHGEAVSIGMVAAAMIAERINLCDRSEVKRIKNLLEKLGLPTEMEKLPADKIIEALKIDKKVRAGKIQFVLPERLGKVVIRNDIPLNLVKQVLRELGAR
ncbi:MAG: 3-dehydroquinate synthase [Candidatus Margulisiibacteriota bacterium]